MGVSAFKKVCVGVGGGGGGGGHDHGLLTPPPGSATY